MKLLFCYSERLDSLRLGHAKQLISWVKLYTLKDFVKKNSVFISCIAIILKHLRTECKIFAEDPFFRSPSAIPFCNVDKYFI